MASDADLKVGVQRLRVRLLGGFGVEGLDERTLGTRKARVVMKRLALALGMAVLHKPGHSVGRNGARALASVRDPGHPAGYLAADRAYSSAKAEDFQLPARALGYRLVFDYKNDQLGVKASS